jgi:hypothetical protein
MENQMASLSLDSARNPARDDNSFAARIHAWKGHDKGVDATLPDGNPDPAEAAAFAQAETPAEEEPPHR